MSGRRSSSRFDDAVEFVVGVGEAGEVALVDDRGGEARLGEDHHAGGRLDQVRAGARADDEEERVLDLAVQPDDAGQAAEHLALAALAQHRRVAAATGGLHLQRDDRAHPGIPALTATHSAAGVCKPGRAQLEQELRRVDHVGRIGGQRQPGECAGLEGVAPQRDEVGGVQGQHQHAEHVFPEEGRGEQVAAEHHLLPDAAGDHDRVEHERLDHDRQHGRGLAGARGEEAQHQREADEEDEELERRQHALHQGPGRRVAAPALFSAVQRGHRRTLAGPAWGHVVAFHEGGR